MNSLDKTQLRELAIKGEKLQAVKLVMQQTNMGLKEAKEYVDEYCLQEKIEVNYSGPSYSAINEGGSIVYYITENGEKHVISKEEAPEFLVNQMENANNKWDEKSSQQNNFPNHKKGRRILTVISLPLIVLGIFFLYQIFISKMDTFDNLAGAIACGVGIAAIYFIELMLWLDETIARRRKKRAEEMEIPAAFLIKGRMTKKIVFVIELWIFVICAILLCLTVVFILDKNYITGLLCFSLFLILVFGNSQDWVSNLKNFRLSLHISGGTIQLYKGNDEIAIFPAATTVCLFSCHSINVDQGKMLKETRGSQGPYPRAFLCNTDGNLFAAIFLDLKEYHLLKKYLIQKGASVTDHYNHF